MKRIGLLLLIGLFIAQWAIPGNMILERENVLEEGKVYKFKTAPIDPNDPFRGKFIRLNFEANEVKTENITDWQRNQEAFVMLEEDDDGYVEIRSISNHVPVEGNNYLRVQVDWIAKPENIVGIRYPFDRFYMEEFKAPAAEKVYRESRADTTQITYAEISIYQGEAVIKDVKINGKSIKDIVANSQTSR